MLLSSLPDMAGRTFEVRGFVFAHASFGSLGGGKPQKMVQELMQQAASLGGDGIVDIKTVIGGDGYCMMTGTAVRFLE